MAALALSNSRSLAVGADLQVERVAVLGVDGEDRIRLGQGLGVPAGGEEHVAQRHPDHEVPRLELQRLAVVEDRLLGLLALGVGVAEGLERAGGAGMQTHRLLERRRGARASRPRPGAGSPAGRGRRSSPARAPGTPAIASPRPPAVELAVDLGQGGDRLRVGRAQRDRRRVGRRRPLEDLGPAAPFRLRVQVLREHQLGLGVLGVEPDRRFRLGDGFLSASRLPQHLRELGPQRAGRGIDAHRLAVFVEGVPDLAGQTGLLGEAEVVIGLGARDGDRARPGGGRLRGGGQHERERDEGRHGRNRKSHTDTEKAKTTETDVHVDVHVDVDVDGDVDGHGRGERKEAGNGNGDRDRPARRLHVGEAPGGSGGGTERPPARMTTRRDGAPQLDRRGARR